MSDDDPTHKLICCQCVKETYLAHEIGQDGVEGKCSYCGSAQACIAVGTLADRIDTAFNHHYSITSDQPHSWQQSLLSDRESDYEWERDGYPVLDVIEAAASIPREAAEDVLEILTDRYGDLDASLMGDQTEFSPDAHYEEKGASAQVWQEEWRDFERSIKTEARFFSRSASDLLARVFGNIDSLTTKPRHQLVEDVGPNRKLANLYRARFFQSDENLEEALCRPDLHLGSPPAQLASPGRMNAHGISVFYGATKSSVALTEVRPPVGSKVLVARFDITRPMRLLNLTALDSVSDGGSIFDPFFKGRLERIAFLRTLSQRMTSPVMPNDEDSEYLVTQAIADFLATENEPRLDGIIFNSAQSRSGRNVVLFHHAASVEKISFPEGTNITDHAGYDTEEGWEADYRVSEAVPEASARKSLLNEFGQAGFFPDFGSADIENQDGRRAALRVVLDTVAVHEINWVKVHSSRFAVTRERYEKRDSKF